MTAPQLVLTLDTSTPQCVMAVGSIEGDRLVAHQEVVARGREASAGLTERLHAVLERAGCAPAELSAVACGVGPGMFTGVRVAIATAKGIALALGVPAIGVSTLAAVGATPLPAPAPAVRLSLLDARRGEVYAGLHRVADGRVEALAPDECAPLDVVLDRLTGQVAAVGPGVDPHRAALEAHPRVDHLQASVGPSAAGLWAATVSRWSDRADPSTLAAVYLRKSYAELGLNPPKRPFVKSPFVD